MAFHCTLFHSSFHCMSCQFIAFPFPCSFRLISIPFNWFHLISSSFSFASCPFGSFCFFNFWLCVWIHASVHLVCPPIVIFCYLFTSARNAKRQTNCNITIMHWHRHPRNKKSCMVRGGYGLLGPPGYGLFGGGYGLLGGGTFIEAPRVRLNVAPR